MYKKLKKQNGERFAQTIRNFHNGILEIPGLDVIVRHAGRDAEPLLPYLMSLLTSNDALPAPISEDPFVLLERAGYNAFYADTLEKQNSIERYFAPGELLCTFNDRARYRNYHLVHAVKKDVDQIRREDFKGKEQRQDAYGTSVISIQMHKTKRFISIKNRYNHAVQGCDHTFDSNPDKIVEGLTAALKERFNVEFSVAKSPLPDGFVLMGNQIFKYNREKNNVYYADQAWAKDGVVHAVDRSAGDALFDGFMFNNKTKTLKNIDQHRRQRIFYPESIDSFADDFNRYYGGNRGLTVDRGGNLTLNGKILIGAEESRIKTINLPALIEMSDQCLLEADALTIFKAPALIKMGSRCLNYTKALMHFEGPMLTTMGRFSLSRTPALTHFKAPVLDKVGEKCLYHSPNLTKLKHLWSTRRMTSALLVFRI